MTVFNTGLNQFTRKYLLKDSNADELSLVQSFQSEYQRILAELTEQFLFFDKVVIKVYGENVGLVVLINELGLKQVLELVEEGAIQFLLWTPMIMSVVGDDLMGKVNPIVSGSATSPVHSKPMESVKMGLQSCKMQSDRRERRELERKISKIYKVTDSKFVSDATDIIVSAYSSNRWPNLD
jgi:hypothetical protein